MCYYKRFSTSSFPGSASALQTVAQAVAYIDDEIEYETYNMDSCAFSITTAYYNGESGTEGRITFDPATGEYTNFFVKDHLGSTRLMLAEDGTIEKVNAYYAYGKRKELLIGPVFNKLRKEFTGKEFDDEGASIAGNDGMNLDYFGKRDYDPEVGRWLSVDPEGQFFDDYAYAGNNYNPISSTDPDGSTLFEKIVNWSVGKGFRDDTYKENYNKGEYSDIVSNSGIKNSSYDDKMTQVGSTHPLSLKINFGKDAFAPNEGFFESVADHELTHRQQWTGVKNRNEKHSSHDNPKNKALREVQACDKVLNNLKKYSLTPSQKKLHRDYRSHYYKTLPAKEQDNVNKGNYGPY